MLIATPVQAIARPEEGAALPAQANKFSDVLSTVTAQSSPPTPGPALAASAFSVPASGLMIADAGIGVQDMEGLPPVVRNGPALDAPAVPDAAPSPAADGPSPVPDAAPSPVPDAAVQAQTVLPEPAIARSQARDASPADNGATASPSAIPSLVPAQPCAEQGASLAVTAAASDPGGVTIEGRPKPKPTAPSHGKMRSEMEDQAAPPEVAGPPVAALESQAKPLAAPVPGPVPAQLQAAQPNVEGPAPASANSSAVAGSVLSVSRLAVPASMQSAVGGQAEPVGNAAPEPATGQEAPAETQPLGNEAGDSGASLLPRSAFETWFSQGSGLSQGSGAGFGQARPEPVAHSAFGSVYPAHAAGAVVEGRPGVAGRAVGVEIARAIAHGRDEMIVRLSPENLGRVEVRIAFDSEGALQAVLSTDQPATTALLQREAPNLVRALADAGIRSDDSSLRFQTPGSGGQSREWSGASSGDRDQGSRQGRNQQGGQSGAEEYPIRSFRAIRAGSRVDLIA